MVGKWLVAKEKNRCAVVFLTATRQRRTNPNGGGRYLVFLEGAFGGSRDVDLWDSRF
jgi:hypothetical protein